MDLVAAGNVQQYHFFPNRPVMRESIPFSQGMPYVFVPQYLREGEVVAVSGIFSANREDDIEISDTSQVVRAVVHLPNEFDRIALVDGVVVLTVSPFRDVINSAHGQHSSEQMRIAQRDVHRMVSTETGTSGDTVRVVVFRPCERQDFVDDIALVLKMPMSSPSRTGSVVVPGLRINAVDTVKLQPALFDVVRKKIHESSVFPIEKSAHRSWKNHHPRAGMSEDKKLHCAVQIVAMPVMILSMHTLLPVSICRVGQIVACTPVVYRSMHQSLTESTRFSRRAKQPV